MDDLGPGQDLERAVHAFGHRGAAFHPVTGVDVFYPRDRLDRRMVDVAADDTVDAGPARFLRDFVRYNFLDERP